MREVGAAQRQDAAVLVRLVWQVPQPSSSCGRCWPLLFSEFVLWGLFERHGLSLEVGVQHVFPLLQGVRVSLTLHSGAGLQALPHADTGTGP